MVACPLDLHGRARVAGSVTRGITDDFIVILRTTRRDPRLLIDSGRASRLPDTTGLVKDWTPMNPGSLLLVDDDKSTLEALADVLRKIGYRTETAQSCSEGCQRIAEFP